ncbi:MAG TPA: GNAT family N-acetyltransferase [Acidimicrobiales bacterium]|nr:GNAT family N-acetyltransferase [Acidimicrobiales bacterium]
MPVRNATPDDVDELVAMVRELAEFERAVEEAVCSPDDLRRHLFSPGAVASALVATPDGSPGEVAGMAIWYRTFSTWEGRSGIWLEDLFVRPAHRRGGLARALLDELRARTDGRVEWSVLDWNTPAIAFYDGLGAAPVPGWTRYRWLPDGSHR